MRTLKEIEKVVTCEAKISEKDIEQFKTTKEIIYEIFRLENSRDDFMSICLGELLYLRMLAVKLSDSKFNDELKEDIFNDVSALLPKYLQR